MGGRAGGEGGASVYHLFIVEVVLGFFVVFSLIIQVLSSGGSGTGGRIFASRECVYRALSRQSPSLENRVSCVLVILVCVPRPPCHLEPHVCIAEHTFSLSMTFAIRRIAGANSDGPPPGASPSTHTHTHTHTHTRFGDHPSKSERYGEAQHGPAQG